MSERPRLVGGPGSFRVTRKDGPMMHSDWVAFVAEGCCPTCPDHPRLDRKEDLGVCPQCETGYKVTPDEATVSIPVKGFTLHR